MTAAPDGSPVELYALLPELGEGERVAEAVSAGGSVLELGCGTGRITGSSSDSIFASQR